MGLLKVQGHVLYATAQAVTHRAYLDAKLIFPVAEIRLASRTSAGFFSEHEEKNELV